MDVSMTIAKFIYKFMFVAAPIILFTSIGIKQANATEVAPFMGRLKPLKDSTPELNLVMNQWIDESIHASNLNSSCDEYDLRKRLLQKSGGQTWTKLEKYISNARSIEKTITSRQESIYKDFTFFESPAIHFVSLSPTINLSGYYVGSDKPGHFIQTGYDYYKIALRHPDKPEKPYSWGMMTERLHLGVLTGGIFSWADLAANHSGFLFWRGLTNPASGLVSCYEGHWTKIRAFDWSEYVNASWDEMINCNDFASQKMRKKAEHNLSVFGSQCPESRTICRQLFKDQGEPIASKILHPSCRLSED